MIKQTTWLSQGLGSGMGGQELGTGNLDISGSSRDIRSAKHNEQGQQQS